MMEVKHISDVPGANSSLHVIETEPEIDPRWEAFLTGLPVGPVYHPAWLKVLEEIYGYKPAHLACEDAAGRVVGILPLFYQRGWRTGWVLKSVFTGPVAVDERATVALLQAAVERVRAEPGVQLHLRVLSNALDGRVDGMVGVPAYSVYLLALPERADLLHLDSTIKRAINKATRSGVEVRQAQTEGELKAWYELYLQTMRKFDALPNPYRYYKTIWQRLHARDMVRLLLAEHVEGGQRRLIAGFFYVLDGQTVSYASAGWREEDQGLRPNDLLHWRAIQDACSDGRRWYDFGDVEPGNAGLARYKSKWGTEARTAYDYSYPMTHDGASKAHILSSSAAQRLLHTAWQRLPTRAIGLLSDWYHALHLY